ncbi:Smr/MutS family protein [Chelativorans intermedius]|uniref:Smr/MutS family protein n=1 Tax=Chelativorans intermedius TaxID=515947 RepID=A0ABV6D8P3_9HYPH|nr:Smr/MutS family protein [Chelativorans intermedius]MCT8998104.1 Smr/MutS family protein [Chelativorans intermedius]
MKRKRLSAEDRVLWSRVARSAVPLKGKAFPDDEEETLPLSVPRQEPPVSSPVGPQDGRAPQPASSSRNPRRLDAPTRRKLATGRLDIGGRVDLHGMTQEEAHILLLTFLRRAFEEERRYVLVITGKGSSGRGAGVLRRAVPQWLSTEPFRTIVGGFEEAARHHGGAGAIYVRLRRKAGRR